MTERFIRIIVNNAHFSGLMALIIIFFGVTSLSQINVAQDPDIDYPVIVLDLYLPGATPALLERNVVYPIEAELRGINGLNDIRSRIRHNHAKIVVRFQPHLATAEKMRDMESAVTQIKHDLPQELEYTLFNATTSNMLSAFLISVRAPWLGPSGEEDAARDLVTALQQVPNLKSIDIIEAPRELVVEMDPARLYRAGIGVGKLRAELEAHNTAAVSGGLPLGESYLRFTGPDRVYQAPKDIADTVLHGAGGKAVRLSELGVLYARAEGDRPIETRYNGQPVWLISAGAESSRSNILEVKAAVQATIDAFRARYDQPPDIGLVFDQAREVNVLLSTLIYSFIQGMAILFVVLLFAVGLRSTLIISSLLPLSFLMAVLLLSFTPFGIQQVSLAGFIIALGLMVDNAIVVTDNTFILQRYNGYSPSEAAVAGTTQAVGPLISSTLTTVLAFAPVFLLTSDTTLYLRSLSASIWLSLLASLFISLTVIALLLSRFGAVGSAWGLPPVPSFLVALIPFRDGVYGRMLRFTVRWRFATMGSFVLLLAGTLYLAGGMKLEIFPVTGNPYFTINIELPKNYTRDGVRRVVEGIEEKLASYPEVVNHTCISGRNFPLLNVSMDGKGDIVCLAETVTGEEEALMRLVTALERDYAPLAPLADVNWSLFKFKDANYSSPFTIVLSGADSRRLQAFGRHIHDTMLAVPGVKSLNNPAKSNQPGFRLDYDAARAARLGIDKAQVDQSVAMLTYGLVLAPFRNHRGTEYPLLLKLKVDAENIEGALRQVMLTAANGRLVPLDEVLSLSLFESESEILHAHFAPVLEIDVWLTPGAEAEAVAARMMERLATMERDPNIQLALGGLLAVKTTEFQGLGEGALLVAALIFAIFVLQFRSFMQPVIVFAAIPFCLIGVVGGLLATGMPITFFAAVGITSLMGIVVNDSILLVDEANRLGREDPDLLPAERAMEAARNRFMPIVLTSVTTIAGLIPLALAATPFKVMAIAIIGGLSSSTLLLLFLVPALYAVLSPRAKPVEMPA